MPQHPETVSGGPEGEGAGLFRIIEIDLRATRILGMLSSARKHVPSRRVHIVKKILLALAVLMAITSTAYGDGGHGCHKNHKTGKWHCH
jgi:hypothetical protein